MSVSNPPSVRDIPPPLKGMIPYLNAAVQFEKKDIVISYYCRVYAANIGIKSKTQGDPKANSVLLSLMSHLEAFKKANSAQHEGLSNEVIAESKVEAQAVSLFSAADKLDRSGTANQNVVKMFFTAAKLFEVLTYFKEDVSDYVRSMYKYAAWKATYIRSCLAKGEVPVPGPATVEGSEEEHEFNELLKQLDGETPPTGQAAIPQNTQMPSVGPPTGSSFGGQFPSGTNPTAAPRQNLPQQTSQDEQPSSSTDNANAKSGAELEQASKFCKFAQSSLMFNDVDTAVNYLEQALAILKS